VWGEPHGFASSLQVGAPCRSISLHELRLTLASNSVVLKGRVAYSRISDVDQEIVTYRSGIELVEPEPERRLTVAATIAGASASSGS